MAEIHLTATSAPIFTSALTDIEITYPGKWLDIRVTISSLSGHIITLPQTLDPPPSTLNTSPSEIYSVRVHSTDGSRLLDLRTIVEVWMSVHAIPAAQVTIYAAGEEDKTGAALTLTLLHSRGTVSGTAADYAANRYLTLSGPRLLPRHRAFDSLSVWSSQEDGEDGTLTLFYYTRSTDPQTTDPSLGTRAPSPAQTKEYPIHIPSGHSRIDIDFQSILDQITSEPSSLNPSPSTLNSPIPSRARLDIGDRSLTWIFTVRQPSAAVSYADNFLSPTHLWMFGSWSRTGKVTQKKVLVGTQYQSAGPVPEPEFTLVTQPLTFTQSYAIPEIAMSRSVWVYLFAQGSPLSEQAFKATPVQGNGSPLAAATFRAIPTEADLDASPYDPDMKQYTLKVAPVSLPDALGYRFEIPRIFTSQFTHPFT